MYSDHPCLNCSHGSLSDTRYDPERHSRGPCADLHGRPSRHPRSPHSKPSVSDRMNHQCPDNHRSTRSCDSTSCCSNRSGCSNRTGCTNHTGYTTEGRLRSDRTSHSVFVRDDSCRIDRTSRPAAPAVPADGEVRVRAGVHNHVVSDLDSATQDTVPGPSCSTPSRFLTAKVPGLFLQQYCSSI